MRALPKKSVSSRPQSGRLRIAQRLIAGELALLKESSPRSGRQTVETEVGASLIGSVARFTGS